LTVLSIGKFSAPVGTVSDGTTVPSICMSGDRTYVDIGSGNILKLSWGTPAAVGNLVDSYTIHILIYDNNSSSYKPLYTENIGNINEFYLKSDIFKRIQQAFIQVAVYLEIHSRFGSSYSSVSDTKFISICRGAGTYMKVSTNYPQPIMKRTLAFSKVAQKLLQDDSGRAITDSAGRAFYLQEAAVQDTSTGWTLMQEFYAKNPDGIWQKSDIEYEILTDINGAIITDVNNSAVYLL
jgi:hypothetical protein